MDISPQDRDLLIRTVIGEAADQPSDGQAGVAYSVLNRLNDGRYGKTIPDVLFAPKQYEPWNTRSRELMSYSQDNPTYQTVGKVVDGIIGGQIKDPTNGATHFADVDTVKQRGNTSALNWINGMQDVVKIGDHTFGKADARPNNMAQNSINLDALASKYGGDQSDDNGFSPAQNGKPPRVTITKYLNGSPSIDIDALSSKYGGDVQTDTSNGSSIQQPVEQQNSKPEFWQNFNDPSLLTGTVPRTGIGILRGAKDFIDTGAHGLGNAVSYVADKTMPESIALPIRQSVQQMETNDLTGRNQFDKEYGDSTAASIGRIGGQIAATLPVMPAKAFQAIRAGMGALPTVTASGGRVAAPLVNRLGAAVGEGALGGGLFGAATSSQNDKSVAENVGQGVITGAVTGPAVVGVAGAGKALGGKVAGSVSSTRAQLAKRAEDLGIPLTATQVSTSPILKKYDQISGMMPFSGAQGVSDKQISGFTRAVSRTFGADTDEITPSVVAAARKRIGGDIESVGRNSTIKADVQLHNDLKQIVHDVHSTVPENEYRPIFQNIQNIIDKIDNNGNITGDAYTSLTNYKATLSKAQSSSNPNIRNAANEIRNALDDALTRSISPQQKADLLKARRQYKAVMTIKDLAEADEEGNVSPLRLMQKVMKSPGGKLRSGELGEIADIGRAFFKKPADSGTPLGELMMHYVAPSLHNPMTALGTAVGALSSGASYGTVGEGFAGLTLNRALRKTANSDFVKNSILNRSLGNTHTFNNDLGNAVVPYSAALKPPEKELQITDRKNKR